MSKIYVEAETGVDFLWANKFEESEQLFASKAATNPRYALHSGEVAFFKGILSELATDRQAAITRFEKAIALAEDHSRTYEGGGIPKGVEIDEAEVPNYALDAQIVAADGYVLLATLQIMEENRLKGLLNMRRGWKAYQQIINKLEKSGADRIVQDSLKFGAGLFYFLISMIPPGMAQRAAALAGFRGGDKEKGLQYLRDSYNANSIRSTLSGLVLALNVLFLNVQFEDDAHPAALKEVHEITHNGLQKYPNGSLFHIFAAVANLEKNNTDHAKMHINNAIENARTIVSAKPPVFMRLLINCHAMNFDWKSASEVLETIIEQEKVVKSKYSWSASWNFLRLGAVYMQLQDTIKSKACLEQVLTEKANEKWPQDLRQQAVKYLKTGGQFAMLELMYLTGHFNKVIRNTTDERRKEILAWIETLSNSAQGTKIPLSKAPRPVAKSRFAIFSKADPHNNPEADNRGIYLVLKGAVLWTLKQNQQAEECLLEIINNNEVFGNDKLYYLMALVLHGRCTAPTRTSEAVAELQTAMKISGVVWENPQKAMARALLEKYGGSVLVGSDAELDKDQVDKILAEEEEEEKQELEAN